MKSQSVDRVTNETNLARIPGRLAARLWSDGITWDTRSPTRTTREK